MELCIICCSVCTAGIIDALGPQRSLQLLKLFNLEIKAKKFDSRAIVSYSCLFMNNRAICKCNVKIKLYSYYL